MALFLEDLTANNNDLTNNGATEVTSSLPFALSTSAAQLSSAGSQYLTAADSASLSITGNMTIEFWVKFITLPGTGVTWELVGKSNPSTNNRSYRVSLTEASGSYRLTANIDQTGDTTTRDVYYVTLSPSTGTWYHYAITITPGNASATTFEFFVGAVSQGNGTASISGNVSSIFDGTSLFAIGQLGDITGPNVDFIIDDIRIWSATRTGTEITNNYNIELVGNEANLAAYWSWESTLGTTTSTSTTTTSTSTTSSTSTSTTMTLTSTSTTTTSTSTTTTSTSTTTTSTSITTTTSTSTSTSVTTTSTTTTFAFFGKVELF